MTATDPKPQGLLPHVVLPDYYSASSTHDSLFEDIVSHSNPETWAKADLAAVRLGWNMHKLASAPVAESQPIPMLLFCPECHHQHIDMPEPELGWLDPPHKSHTCKHCRAEGKTVIWRPADVATTGVADIKTSGGNDTWSGPQPERQRGGEVVPAAWHWTMIYETGEERTRVDERGPDFFACKLGEDFSPFGRRGYDHSSDFVISAIPLYLHQPPPPVANRELDEAEERRLFEVYLDEQGEALGTNDPKRRTSDGYWRRDIHLMWLSFQYARSQISRGEGRDKKDAARYRWIQMRMRGGYGEGAYTGQRFILSEVPVKANIMKGGVAGHLDDAIDAALASDAAQGKGE